VETFGDWQHLRSVLGAAAPALTLDVGHLYAVDEGDPATVIAAAGPWLAQVHLEDMRRGEHQHRLPGTGDVDFAGVLKALEGAGYRGPVCFELSRSSHQAPAAVAACRELWERCRSGTAR
jgi:sugar phosphate isomerase/epimerase